MWLCQRVVIDSLYSRATPVPAPCDSADIPSGDPTPLLYRRRYTHKFLATHLLLGEEDKTVTNL